MELIKLASRRTRVSEVVYIALNVLLAVSLLILVRLFDPPYLAVGLVLLSKWRVLAVRPRFWFAHVQSNLIDTLVGLSFVGLLYLAGESILLQLILTGLYAAWLLVLKPRSRRSSMALQAGIGQFAALTVLFSFSHHLPSTAIVLGCWLVGYAAARHMLSSYEEDEIELLSLAWALIVAELGWLYYHWTIAYAIAGGLIVPQIAVVTLLVGFVAQHLYDFHKHRGALAFSQVRVPLLFVVGILAVLFIWFSPWSVVL